MIRRLIRWLRNGPRRNCWPNVDMLAVGTVVVSLVYFGGRIIGGTL